MSYWNASAIRERIRDYLGLDRHVAVKVRSRDAASVLMWAIEHCDERAWGALDFPTALELYVAAAGPKLPPPPKARPVSRERAD